MSEERLSARIARISSSEGHVRVKALLEANQASSDHTSTIADCPFTADLGGVDTRGVNRFPFHVARIWQGVLGLTAEPELEGIAPIVAQVDGKNGSGLVAARLGMTKAIDMARYAVLTWCRCNTPTTLACRHGLFSKLCMLLSCLLCSPTSVQCYQYGEESSGALSGPAFAGHITNPYYASRPADVGHLLVVIKSDLFMSMDEFKVRVEYLYQRVVSSYKMAEVDRIYMP